MHFLREKHIKQFGDKSPSERRRLRNEAIAGSPEIQTKFFIFCFIMAFLLYGMFELLSSLTYSWILSLIIVWVIGFGIGSFYWCIAINPFIEKHLTKAELEKTRKQELSSNKSATRP